MSTIIVPLDPRACFVRRHAPKGITGVDGRDGCARVGAGEVCGS